MDNKIVEHLINLGYTDSEIAETVIRHECGMPLPAEVKSDINQAVICNKQ